MMAGCTLRTGVFYRVCHVDIAIISMHVHATLISKLQQVFCLFFLSSRVFQQ